jgi:hypothetical protein
MPRDQVKVAVRAEYNLIGYNSAPNPHSCQGFGGGTMRILATAFAIIHAIAAMQAPRPTFAGITWGASSDAAIVKAFVDAGLTSRGKDKDGDFRFEGRLFDEDAVVFAFISPTAGLVKVQITLLTPDTKARSAYEEVVKTLFQKYGEGQKIERYTTPYYKGDGYEDQAIQLGKGLVATMWGDNEQPSTTALIVKISDKLNVEIAYEDHAWSTEIDRRRKKTSTIF